MRLIPDTIGVVDCLDVRVKFENMGADTLVLEMSGSAQAFYFIEVSDSGTIWFPQNDSYDLYLLHVAPGDSIVKVVPFCAYRGGNTLWSKIDYDTLASETYTMNAGIAATNLECCTRGKATFVVK